MHRKFDDSFKIMAVELRVARGSLSEVAKELDVPLVYIVNGVGTHDIMVIKFYLTSPK